MHGGVQGFYEMDSAMGSMRFGVFMPSRSLLARVPALYFLAGLECNEETFATKSGAQRIAQELGMAIVTCDTSPRTSRIPGDDASWDFGIGAGFYVDATQAPWSAAYRMETHGIMAMPVIGDDDRLVGVVHLHDLLRARVA